MKKAPKMKAALRINSSNPNHHLYLNNGTWWIHYTVHLENYTAKRIRHSLETPDISEARLRRDSVIEGLMKKRRAA